MAVLRHRSAHEYQTISLTERYSLIDLWWSDKTRLLQELSRRAAASLDWPAERIAAEILKREDLGSTGTGGGVAIPHARIQGLNRSFGILARLNKPIDFEAIDGRPVDLLFLLLLPANPAGEELKALASVARKLREPGCLCRLRSAGGTAGLYDAITE
jgi:PTS system nitrogen regulatory IIA component